MNMAVESESSLANASMQDAEAKPPAFWPWLEAIVCGVSLVYLLGPWRAIIPDLSMFAVSVVVLLLLPKSWLPEQPEIPSHSKPHVRCLWIMTVFTLLGIPSLVAYGAYGYGRSLKVLQACGVVWGYLPFALLQQYAMQRYLTMRFAARLARGNHVVTVFIAAALFSVLHLPFPVLVIPTFIGGLVWTHCFLTTGKIVWVTVSHAILGSIIFNVIIGVNPFGPVLALF